MQHQHKGPGLIDRIESEATDVHPILRWVLENIKLLGLAAGVLLLVVAGHAAYTSHQQSSRIKDQNRLGLILAQSHGQERTLELEEFVASGSHFGNKAMLELARAQMEAGDFAAAAATWDRLARTTLPDLKTIAVMGKARSMSLDGKPGEAMALLLDHKRTAPAPFQSSLNLQIAEAAEEAGDIETALSTYASLRQSTEDEADGAFYEFKIATLKDQIS
jgi:predicted negative regulator of RcsB-dependent stress response